MNQSVLRQYEAVLNGVGWRDLSMRGKVRVTGPDRITFLHSMISNEVEGLADYAGNYGSFLTAAGKILADFFYYRFPEELLVDVKAELATDLVKNLENYIIMDDVELTDISEELGHFAFDGPGAPDLLGDLLDSQTLSTQYAVNRIDWKGAPLCLIRKDTLIEPGFEVVVPDARRAEFRDWLILEGRDQGLEQVGDEAYELLRLEQGIPLHGVDFTDKNSPVEARLEGAYSLTKGCYLGQEVVSKATHVGSVPKALSRLKVKSEEVPEKGALVFTEKNREIGRITSAVFSPQLGGPIALAYLKRGFWEPGDVYRVEMPSEGSAAVVVVESFRLES